MIAIPGRLTGLKVNAGDGKKGRSPWNTRNSETPEWMCPASALVAWDSGMRSVGFTNGCSNEDNSRPVIQKALELGINFFDTANVYSIGRSEEILGRALKDFANRDEVVIATKVHGRMHEGPNGAGLSRKAILSEIDKSLERLGTDYVDLYQIHRWDYQTPIEETMEALDDVVRAGKARYIGASAMFAWQFQKALHVAEKHGWTRFVSMQDHLNLHLPRRGARDAAALPRGEDRGDPIQSARIRKIDS